MKTKILDHLDSALEYCQSFIFALRCLAHANRQRRELNQANRAVNRLGNSMRVQLHGKDTLRHACGIR
jgi:hypothetical protein